jgi:hypothetical protein
MSPSSAPVARAAIWAIGIVLSFRGLPLRSAAANDPRPLPMVIATDIEPGPTVSGMVSG